MATIDIPLGSNEEPAGESSGVPTELQSGQTAAVDADLPSEVSTDVATPLAIPEKFQNEDGTMNQQAFLQAYAAAEKTLSQGQPEADAAAPEAATLEAAEVTGSLDESLAKWGKEYTENGGKLTDKTMTAIMKDHNVDRAFVENHMEGQAAIATLQVQAIQALVGGPEQYQKMINWVGKDLGADEYNSFLGKLQEGMAASDEGGLKNLLSGMEARWKGATSQAWNPEVTGTDPSGARITPYASYAEFQAAMGDPNYGDDAFQRMHDAKHALSKKMNVF